MTLAETLHNADNPANLANLLSAGLNFGLSQIAPTVVPTSATARPVVTETPGAGALNEQPQIDEVKSNPIKKYGPIAAIGLVVVIVLGLVFKK